MKTEKERKAKFEEETFNIVFAQEGQDMTQLMQMENNKAKAKATSVMEQVFQLYSNLIAEKASQPSTKIVVTQINVTPLTNIQGVQHSDKGCSLWDSFMKCIKFHLPFSTMVPLRPKGTSSATAS